MVYPVNGGSLNAHDADLFTPIQFYLPIEFWSIILRIIIHIIPTSRCDLLGLERY